tara:strand:+ start:347 stop:610 length:264 start_codon:yes stop_codon:yes gene_type:complete
MFSIITTNKKRTATAPTYTINNVIARNSALEIKNIIAALKKHKIKYSTEYTGFLETITIKLEKIKIAEKIEKMENILINILTLFLNF